MTAIERVKRTQRSLQLLLGSSILFWAVAAAFAILIVSALLVAFVHVPAGVAAAARLLAIVAALGVLGLLSWRTRFIWSSDRVALWLEERAPELRYALVTAIDPRYQGETAQLMEPVVSRVDTGPFLGSVAKRATLPALAALVAAVVVFGLLPANLKKMIGAGNLLNLGKTPTAIVGNRLTPLDATLTPPAYSHFKTELLHEPSMNSGLVGSRVVLSGRGSPDGIQVTMETMASDETQGVALGDSANDDSEAYEAAQWAAEKARKKEGKEEANEEDLTESNNPVTPPKPGVPQKPGAAPQNYKQKVASVAKRAPVVVHKAPIITTLPVTGTRDGWSVAFVLSDSNPALLKLVDRQYHRSVILDPHVDQPPVGRLLLPVRDTTLRVIDGTLAMSAVFNDDIGLDTARFEYIKCSSGTGDEDFKCVDGVYKTTAFHDAKTGEFTYSLPFTSLGLTQGDQLSVRAVVWDHNTVTGPGKGVTETRTIRIARKSEYEKVNVTPAPPSADTALITLRMLIMAVANLDTLHMRKKIEQVKYEDSSIALSGVGEKVQGIIELIIEDQTGGGLVPVNPLLALARDSMWTAVTNLQIADTHGALPPLIAAYNALKKYSNIARYYLRGVLKVPVVNIDRVRLTGKDSGSSTPRMPRLMSEGERIRYMRYYLKGMQQLTSSPSDAMDSFQLLQVETLRKYPSLAQTINEAVSAIRAKRDPSVPLARARRMIEGSAASLDTLPVWSGTW